MNNIIFDIRIKINKENATGKDSDKLDKAIFVRRKTFLS